MEEVADLFLPVMESATVLASHYAKACGRDTVTAYDVQMGLMYAARNVAGKQIGSLYPEIYDEEDDEEEDEWEEVEEVEEGVEPYTRYSGSEELFNKMNECFDTWSEWVPETPLEISIKNAVDKAGQNI